MSRNSFAKKETLFTILYNALMLMLQRSMICVTYYSFSRVLARKTRVLNFLTPNMAARGSCLRLCIAVLFVCSTCVTPLECKKMKITGKITVSEVEEGISLGKESFLTVKLEDTSVMDASAVVLGEYEQLLPLGTKLGPDGLNYTIICEKPPHLGPMNSLSAVLNVGWKPTGDQWIRKGDYFTDTTHPVDLTQETEPIVADIVMVHYP